MPRFFAVSRLGKDQAEMDNGELPIQEDAQSKLRSSARPNNKARAASSGNARAASSGKARTASSGSEAKKRIVVTNTLGLRCLTLEDLSYAKKVKGTLPAALTKRFDTTEMEEKPLMFQNGIAQIMGFNPKFFPEDASFKLCLGKKEGRAKHFEKNSHLVQSFSQILFNNKPEKTGDCFISIVGYSYR